jgi:hypothetical protein
MQLSIFDVIENLDSLEKTIIEPKKEYIPEIKKEHELESRVIYTKTFSEKENLIFTKTYDSPVFNMEIEVYQIASSFVNACSYNFKVGTFEGCSWNHLYAKEQGKIFTNITDCFDHLKDYIKFRMNELLDRSDPNPIQKKEVSKIIMFLDSFECLGVI